MYGFKIYSLVPLLLQYLERQWSRDKLPCEADVKFVAIRKLSWAKILRHQYKLKFDVVLSWVLELGGSDLALKDARVASRVLAVG